MHNGDLKLPFELNIAQEIFSFFFAIFYGIMIETTGWLHPFSTHEALKQGIKSKASKRFIVSISLLNLIPLLYFVIVLNHLSFVAIQFPVDNLVGYLKILSVVLLTLSIFGFYRIYVGLMVRSWRRLYRSEHWRSLREERVKRYNEATIEGRIEINGEILEKTIFDDWLAHFVPGIWYVCICALPFLLITLNILFLIVDLYFLLIFAIIWRAHKK